MSNLTVYHDVSDMASLMKKCDIAITAGGSTIYELAAIGVPMICFSYALNQEQLVRYMGENVTVSIGSFDKDKDTTLKNLEREFLGLCDDYNKRKEISLKEKRVVDAQGVMRIVQKITNI